jgi:hypothetical protein
MPRETPLGWSEFCKHVGKRIEKGVIASRAVRGVAIYDLNVHVSLRAEPCEAW